MDTQLTNLAQITESGALLLLLPFLVVAMGTDIARRRIPNLLIVNMLGCGVVFQAALFGTSGLLWSLGGAVVGLLILLPFYALGGMGAGDVKLLAAAGSFLGPLGALLAGMITLGAGGILAVAAVAWQALYVLARSRSRATLQVSALHGTGLRLRYSLAIAAGTCIAAYDGSGARFDSPTLSGLLSW